MLDAMFDLFAALDATDAQLDFPVLYGSAKQGWMAAHPDGPSAGVAPLLDTFWSMLRRRKWRPGRSACSRRRSKPTLSWAAS